MLAMLAIGETPLALSHRTMPLHQDLLRFLLLWHPLHMIVAGLSIQMKVDLGHPTTLRNRLWSLRHHRIRGHSDRRQSFRQPVVLMEEETALGAMRDDRSIRQVWATVVAGLCNTASFRPPLDSTVWTVDMCR